MSRTAEQEASGGGLDLLPYAGRWVAMVKGRVAGVGSTAKEAYLSAKRSRPREEPEVVFVPAEIEAERLMTPFLQEIYDFLKGRCSKFYLVGGYVRDLLMGHPSRDIDFAVAGDAMKLARKVANRFGGFFVPLDEERHTARAVFRDEEGEVSFVDLARLRGDGITADLALRDFTINAMAIDLNDPSEFRLIDPYNGQGDLKAKTIRAVSDTAFKDDPLRALRAVRLAAELGFHIEPKTEELLRRDAHLITKVSAERVRDELSKILAQPNADRHLRQLDDLGLLGTIIPEVERMKGVKQPKPHHLDVFAHSLETVGRLEEVIEILKGERSASPFLHPLSSVPYPLEAHLSQPTSGGRTRLILLKLIALLHDVGKPLTKSIDQDGCIHFYGHAEVGGRMAGDILRRLRFSSNEVRLACTAVAHHMRPMRLAKQERITNGDVYRFFRDTSEAGIDILLLYLADHLATWGPNLRPARWRRRVELVNLMLADYYQRREEVISPPKLLDGRDLMREFGLEEGPRIGELLEAVREAQVEGKVKTKEEALAYVKRVLRNRDGKGLP